MVCCLHFLKRKREKTGVTTIIVVPMFWFNVYKSFIIIIPVFESKLPVGSLAKNNVWLVCKHLSNCRSFFSPALS